MTFAEAIEDVEAALDLAAGTRMRTSAGYHNERATANEHDRAVMRKIILLFLENLDADMTVSELREYLDM